MVRLIGVRMVKPSKMKGKKIWTLQWGSLEDKKKLRDYLYTPDSTWLLERKRDRVIQLCNQELSLNVFDTRIQSK